MKSTDTLEKSSTAFTGTEEALGWRSNRSPETASPRVTVVTAVLNGAKYLEQTIQSIRGQTYPHVEYIVIDGGSTDGTLDLIRQYASVVDQWISEPDTGIYDAMNKGVALARGEWINFLGAGDRFYEDTTLERVFSMAWPNTDVIFGNTHVTYWNRFSRVRRSESPESFWKGIPVGHQAVFTRTSLVKRYQFNPANKTASDYELLYKIFRSQGRFTRIHQVIASIPSGGVSDRDRWQGTKEVWAIARQAEPSLKTDIYLMLALARVGIVSFIKWWLPAPMMKRLLQLKYAALKDNKRG